MESQPMTPNSVLVGVDSSAEARHALMWAAAEAVRREAPLHVMHVSPASRTVPAPAGEPDLDMGTWVCRHAVKRALAAHPELAVTSEVRLGRAAAQLVESSHQAALVVLGAHGHGAVVGRLLGSVSQQVATHAHCPVAVVRGEDTDRSLGPVVVGVDTSDQARAALETAITDARRRGVGVRAVHAAYTDVVAVEMAPAVLDIERGLVQESAEVAEMVTAVAERHPDVRVDLHDERGHPVEVLRRASQEASVLVLGTRGRGGFASLVLGSVSLGVLGAATCTVVIVREGRPGATPRGAA